MCDYLVLLKFELLPPFEMSKASGSHSGRPRESAVWNYFFYDSTKGKSTCQVSSGDASESSVCGMEINGKYPTNLKAHLKAKHPGRYTELCKMEEELKEKAKQKHGREVKLATQLSIEDATKRTKKYTKESEKYQKITRKLATFVGVGYVANSIVDSQEFRDLIAELDDRYTVPNRAAISKEMDRVFVDLKASLLSVLRDSRRVSLTVDIWSRKSMTASYLGVTAHFFTRSDHKRRNATIAVRRLPSPHTAERVEEIVEEVMGEWELSRDKVSAILTDNGSNMVAAFREWVDMEADPEDVGEDTEETAVASTSSSPLHEEETMSEDGEEQENGADVLGDISNFEECELEFDVAFTLHKRISCFAHVFQLVVRKFDSVRSLKRVLASAHRLVKKVNKSVKATEKLIALSGRKLVSNCPTRWNSSFLLIERLLSVKDELSQVLVELGWDGLQNSEWKTLEQIHFLLEPFAKYTSLTSGEEFTTISTVIPVLMELDCHLEAVRPLYVICILRVYCVFSG